MTSPRRSARRQPAPVRQVSDAERRRRLAVRHALTPDTRLGSVEAATRAMTVLHATEPATVYVSCWARVNGFHPADLDQALYRSRTLVKQLAMRRTLFVVPRELLPAVWPSASARVARTERLRMAQDVVKAGIAEDGDAWLDRARAEVLRLLADKPEGRPASQVRQAIPMLDLKVAVSAGSVWSAPRILTHLGATADIVRGTNDGHWRSARPRWTLTRHWLGDMPEPWDEADGYRELVHRWLRTFGPGTEDDIVWWLGATKAAVRAALAELDAVPVALDHGETGWLRPDDLDEVADPGPWAALLPLLDPTVMGWKHRDFYLGRHRDQLFDSTGNAGTTAWVDGRVVGYWVQDQAGVVRVRELEPVAARGRRALEAEAERLTAWLGGLRLAIGVTSPAMLADPLGVGSTR